MALAPNPLNAPPSSAPLAFGAVTPSDSVPIGGAQFLRVGGGGVLALKGLNDAGSTTFTVGSGEYVPFGAGYVMATGTTATGIIGFW